MKTKTPTTYEKEILSALYASLDFMQCNNLPSSQVEEAIISIESKYKK
jgi:hypothetical protein